MKRKTKTPTMKDIGRLMVEATIMPAIKAAVACYAGVCPCCGKPVVHINRGATQCLKERDGKCAKRNKT
jgi:hypothetical protein